MVYGIDCNRLLGLYTVAPLLGEVREISDAADRSELLTKAQIILTAFIIDLEPLAKERRNAFGLTPCPGEIPGLDA